MQFTLQFPNELRLQSPAPLGGCPRLREKPTASAPTRLANSRSAGASFSNAAYFRYRPANESECHNNPHRIGPGIFAVSVLTLSPTAEARAQGEMTVWILRRTALRTAPSTSATTIAIVNRRPLR